MNMNSSKMFSIWISIWHFATCSFSEGLPCVSHFVSVLKYKIILKQSRQHVNPKDARIQVHFGGRGLADRIDHHQNPSASGANQPEVEWASVETDK